MTDFDLVARVAELEKAMKKQQNIIDNLIKAFNSHRHQEDTLENDTYFQVKEADKT